MRRPRAARRSQSAHHKDRQGEKHGQKWNGGQQETDGGTWGKVRQSANTLRNLKNVEKKKLGIQLKKDKKRSNETNQCDLTQQCTPRCVRVWARGGKEEAGGVRAEAREGGRERERRGVIYSAITSCVFTPTPNINTKSKCMW